MELSLRPGLSHFIFFLLIALVEPAALPSQPSAENEQTTAPLWLCANGSEEDTTGLKDDIGKNMSEFCLARQRIMYGYPSFGIPGANELEFDGCDDITIPDLPHFVSHHNNDRQHMANISWDVQFLNEMYKKTFKLIMIREFLPTLNTTYNHIVAKLTLMQVLIDNFIESIENYLMAKGCSCKNATYLTRQLQLPTETANCTKMNYLGKLLKAIDKQRVSAKRILDLPSATTNRKC